MRLAPSMLALGALAALGIAALGRSGAQDKAPPPVTASTPAIQGSSARSLAPVAQLPNVPVGVAVSRHGRTFLAFSRAIDEDQPSSVGELVRGKVVPFPEGYAQDKGPPGEKRLLSVQALTVDARDRLWILDTGKVGQEHVAPSAPKLVAVDLGSNRVIKSIDFPPEIAGATSFLNDVRIDLGRGREGTAFITDSSIEGPNGLVVVDLASGKSVRRLENHPSTRAAPGFVAMVEGKALVMKGGKSPGEPFQVGADGLALDADGKHLWYAPLSSHHLWRVSVDALADASRSDAEVASTVEDLGDKGFASDGLLADAQGRLYLTDYEHNAIVRRNPNGNSEVIVQDPRLLWPDSMALDAQGNLTFTTTQIERGKLFQGSDLRLKPFTVWKVKTDSRPLLPRAASHQARSAAGRRR